MTTVRKITVTPVFGLPKPLIDGDDFSSRDLPFEIWPDLFLADIHAPMKELDLTLWSREYLSKHDVEKIRGWGYALVHYYNEGEFFHGDEEQRSRDLLQKAFMGLRIVRPSRVPYQYLHARVKPDGSFDPSGFSRAEMQLAVLPCDRWTPIRRKDAEILKAVVPALLRAYETRCQPVTRAIRILEMGYITSFPDVRELLWVTALESLFTSASYNGAPLVSSRLRQFLGSRTRIYEQADYHSSIRVPSLTVKNVLEDIYVVRNRLAHGEWFPKQFLERPGYVGGATNYAEVLMEATGILLRLALIRILKESLLDTFCDKDKLDKYFSYDPASGRRPCSS